MKNRKIQTYAAQYLCPAHKFAGKERSMNITMDEKAYKTMGSSGAANLAIGICILIGGITAGIILIVNGGRLLKNKSKLIF